MSDNGTNFVGASRKIKESWETITENSKNSMAYQEIEWKFIPPYSPSFGGL
jgi:hypothetical protein